MASRFDNLQSCDETKPVAEPHRSATTKELLVCFENLADLGELVSNLASKYRVLRATSEVELLNRVAEHKYDLVIIDGAIYSRELLDTLLIRQSPKSLLFVTGGGHLESLADALASQHEIRVFAAANDSAGLLAHVESVLFPRTGKRHHLSQLFLEMNVADGRSTCLPVADISNRGCAVYLRSDQTYYVPCVPGAVLAGARLVLHGKVIMDEVDALVRYADAVQSSSDLHDARLGLEFIKGEPPQDLGGLTEERVSDPVQVFALIKEGLKKKKKASGILEPLGTDRRFEIHCSRVDFEARQLQVSASMPLECEQGDVVRISFELGGARYAFLSSVVIEIPAEAGCNLLIRMPRALSRTRRRAHHRLKPTPGQVTVNVASPFGTGQVATNVADLTSSGMSFAIDRSRDLFPIGTVIDPIVINFPERDAFSLSGRVRALAESGNGALKCGVEFQRVAPKMRIALADSIVDATRPRVTDGIGTAFDDVWGLMEESGFLYPQKRRLLRKASVRSTFEPLLAEVNPVLKTLVSRDEGELLGHLSAVRVYSRTWEIQHLATKTSGNALVLGRHLYMAIVEYLDQRDDSVWIRALFQPSNRWANRIFARYERRVTDTARKESLVYDYVVVDNRLDERRLDDSDIDIRPMEESDLRIVEQLLATTGKAVSLQALDLNANELSLASVGGVYRTLSLERRREAIVAETNGRVRGFAFLEFSSPGLNLSEVTNSFTPYVVDQRDYDAIQALGHAARERYRTAGYDFTVGLVEPNTTPALEMAGYSRLRRYLCITAHRDLYRRLYDYLAGRFR